MGHHHALVGTCFLHCADFVKAYDAAVERLQASGVDEATKAFHSLAKGQSIISIDAIAGTLQMKAAAAAELVTYAHSVTRRPGGPTAQNEGLSLEQYVIIFSKLRESRQERAFVYYTLVGHVKDVEQQCELVSELGARAYPCESEENRLVAALVTSMKGFAEYGQLTQSHFIRWLDEDRLAMRLFGHTVELVVPHLEHWERHESSIMWGPKYELDSLLDMATRCMLDVKLPRRCRGQWERICSSKDGRSFSRLKYARIYCVT